MPRFDLLTNLPSTLSCIVLRDWLNLKAVIILNSAYSCHLRRKDSLNLLKSEEYFIREQVTINLSCSRNSNVTSMLKRLGEKMRSVELNAYRWNSGQPVPVQLVTAYCHHLTHLQFSAAEACTPELWDVLRANTHIGSLTISHTNIDSPSLPCSFDDVLLSKLSTLAVTGYSIQNKNILGAFKGGNVVRLNLTLCQINGSVLLEICSHCPLLDTLVLSFLYAESLADDICNELTILCPRIAHLNISDAEQITDGGILSIVRNLRGLRSLNIINVYQLTNESLAHIYTYCANTLHTLMLNCYNHNGRHFSSSVIESLLERCTQLRVLYLYDCMDGYSRLVFSAAAICNLTKLAISGDIVSDEKLAVIGTHCVHLEKFEIDSVHVHYLLFNLIDKWPKLRKLNYDLRSRQGVIPDDLLFASRERTRPGLTITLKCIKMDADWKPTTPDCFNF